MASDNKHDDNACMIHPHDDDPLLGSWLGCVHHGEGNWTALAQQGNFYHLYYQQPPKPVDEIVFGLGTYLDFSHVKEHFQWKLEEILKFAEGKTHNTVSLSISPTLMTKMELMIFMFKLGWGKISEDEATVPGLVLDTSIAMVSYDE